MLIDVYAKEGILKDNYVMLMETALVFATMSAVSTHQKGNLQSAFYQMSISLLKTLKVSTTVFKTLK